MTCPRWHWPELPAAWRALPHVALEDLLLPLSRRGTTSEDWTRRLAEIVEARDEQGLATLLSQGTSD